MHKYLCVGMHTCTYIQKHARQALTRGVTDTSIDPEIYMLMSNSVI